MTIIRRLMNEGDQVRVCVLSVSLVTALRAAKLPALSFAPASLIATHSVCLCMLVYSGFLATRDVTEQVLWWGAVPCTRRSLASCHWLYCMRTNNSSTFRWRANILFGRLLMSEGSGPPPRVSVRTELEKLIKIFDRSVRIRCHGKFKRQVRSVNSKGFFSVKHFSSKLKEFLQVVDIDSII